MPTAYIQLGANCSSPSICIARATGWVMLYLQKSAAAVQYLFGMAMAMAGQKVVVFITVTVLL